MTSVGSSKCGPLFSNSQHQGLRLVSVDSASFPCKADNESALREAGKMVDRSVMMDMTEK